MTFTARSLTVFSAIMILCSVPASAQFLYSGDSFTPTIRSIDPSTGTTISSSPINLPGETVEQVKGLAAHPTTGMLYAVLKIVAPVDGILSLFVLATVRPDTGDAVMIGDLGDRFSGLAFASDGTLYGVTGDGAATPETLYTVSTNDATMTFFMTLGNGDNGEAIAYNTADGFLYHLSGEFLPPPVEGGGGNQVFERIDLTTQIITNIPLSGDTFFRGNGMAYRDTNGEFWFTGLVPGNGGSEGGGIADLHRVTTSGVVTTVGLTDEYAGGMAFSDFVPVELQSFTVE